MTPADVTPPRRDYRRLALAVARWALTIAATALLAFLAFVVREQDTTIQGLRAENVRDQEIQGEMRTQILADCESHRDWVELPAAAASAAAARTPGAVPTINPFAAQLAGNEARAYVRKGCDEHLGPLPALPTVVPQTPGSTPSGGG